jgi:hypothetical protein
MNYPTADDYQKALQFPELVFFDPDLRAGEVDRYFDGTPCPSSGSAAMIYDITAKKGRYAVKCFTCHKDKLERRYNAISDKLTVLKSSYFLDFQFHKRGIAINGTVFPIVKMSWATGQELGDFIEEHYRDRQMLANLCASLRKMASCLEQQKLAHGDIQCRNLMVSDYGKTLQLIDYDGIYIDKIAKLGSAEIGHKHFQHPQRNASVWNPLLDRFAFILLDIALRALQSQPDLWIATQPNPESVLFKEKDFLDPDNSDVFKKLMQIQDIRDDVYKFNHICKASIMQIPSLEVFVEGEQKVLDVADLIDLCTNADMRPQAQAKNCVWNKIGVKALLDIRKLLRWLHTSKVLQTLFRYCFSIVGSLFYMGTYCWITQVWAYIDPCFYMSLVIATWLFFIKILDFIDAYFINPR